MRARHLAIFELVILTAFAALACSSAPRPANTPLPSTPATPTAAVAPTFSWPGVYDIIGSGFPDGERRADPRSPAELTGPRHLLAPQICPEVVAGGRASHDHSIERITRRCVNVDRDSGGEHGLVA